MIYKADLKNFESGESKQDHFLFHSVKYGMTNARIWHEFQIWPNKNYGNLTDAGLRNRIVISVYLNIRLALKDLSG